MTPITIRPTAKGVELARFATSTHVAALVELAIVAARGEAPTDDGRELARQILSDLINALTADRGRRELDARGGDDKVVR